MTSMITAYVDNIKHRNDAAANAAQDNFRTHVKPYRPKGRILRKSPYSLTHAIKEDMRSLKYFADGIQGKGTDYSVGRINDVAIKLGGLGIAGILATGKGSPLQKGMEFIGLACWLGAMSLWPKLAINLPIKALRGVDLNMEYISSRGDRKKFYQDPQFICWDMISDKQMNKMGDKLGVPKNIQNRRKAIENKARQVAIQGNTLALLTAGFATPLVASLAADQIGKKVYSPLLTKLSDIKADLLKDNMCIGINNLVSNTRVEEFIDKELPQTISPKTKKGIFYMFDQLTPDETMRASVHQTLENILGGRNVTEAKVKIDENISKSIVELFAKGKNAQTQETIAQAVKTVAEEYNKSLDSYNITGFVERLKSNLVTNRLLSAKNAQTIGQEAVELLNSAKTVKLVSGDETAAQLINLSRLLNTYNQKMYKTFEKGFYNLVWNSDVSLNAKIWEKMPKSVFSALEIDNSTLRRIANAPSEEATTKIVGEVLDKIAANPGKYDDAIKKLGIFAARESLKNEKHLRFSLDYIDQMQRLLTAYDATGEFSNITKQITASLSRMRKTILGKYLSANTAMFAPIQILDVLRTSYGKPEYETVKNILMNNITVDAFINKLDNFKGVIPDENQYKQFINLIFSKLSERAKSSMSKEIAAKIDDTTELVKHLLIAQSDGVNIKYPMTDSNAVVNLMKKLNLGRYIDEIFEVNLSNQDNIVESIKQIIMRNPGKIDELKTFLKLSPEEIFAIRSGNFTALYNHCKGAKEIGSGFFESGGHRIKTLLDFFGTNQVDVLGNIAINKARTGKASAMQAPTLKNFIKNSAKEALAYNGWLKKVGFAFVGLCAVTAFAIFKTGKKNEFNPDIYKERYNL